MKNLAILLLLCLALSATAQRKDTLQMDIENIKLNLELCHNTYKSGTTLIVAGVFCNAIGIALISTDTELAVPMVVFSLGSILSLMGTIKQIDSHKYIGRASYSYKKDNQ